MKMRLLLCASILAVGIILFAGLMSVAADPPPPMYWKPGVGIDYAPNGLPDFDQKQDNWGLGGPPPIKWTFCGPVAVANSLWWFDSKYEPNPIQPPVINDNYFLVASYNPLNWDDHDPNNLLLLVQDLALWFDTDGRRTVPPLPWQGTNVYDMFYGLQWYLYGRWPLGGLVRPGSYYDEYYVTLKKMPDFNWVAEEVLRSEDVILLLGFWQEQAPGYWVRIGGHFVTVAGVNAVGPPFQIAFSDPFFDTAELGLPGRVMNGNLILHNPPPHAPHEHNDAGNLSHDIYTVVTTTTSPHGLWEIEGYPYDPYYITNFEQQNCPPEFEGVQGTYNPLLPIFTEVEYAIAMSPFYWKPGGEWVWMEDWGFWEWWWYDDDGDSCLPDFSQLMKIVWGWAYDGPVAIANSFWWFDSKYETLITGGWPVRPPTKSDHYDLVTAYDNYDDHDKQNIVPLVEDLAEETNTSASQGTTVENMVAGIGDYLGERNLLTDFYTKTMQAPSFDWVAHEVTTCEDVILLLGFWEEMADGSYERKGGHYVNAAGVHVAEGGADKDQIGLSDPGLDHAVKGAGLGRVFPPESWKTGFDPLKPRDPSEVSHDIYPVGLSPVPDGQWSLVDYPATDVITNFVGLNGGGTSWGGGTLYTVVEWAMAVSPMPALDITKTVVEEEVFFGDWITYTISFSNVAPYTVTNVIIDDPLPSELVTETASFTYTTSTGSPITHTVGSYYQWQVGNLAYRQGGVITVTAQVSTGLGLETLIITNTVAISGTNPLKKFEVLSDTAQVTAKATPPKVYLPIILKKYTQ